MMQSTWQFLTTRNSLLVIGWIAFAALLLIGATLLEVPLAYAFGVLAIAFSLGILVWLWRRRRRLRNASELGSMINNQVSGATVNPAQRQEHDVIKKRMLDAIATIKGSKLGQLSGDAALYELPWYMVIGNPAAGKSTMIASSGLQFPFAGSKVVQGVGGTRNCDWFFTTDGILLDTAGRYSVVNEDRAEWFGFLSLLKKHRKKAPINGIIIAVSVAELTGNRPEFAINLAKNLRMRIQELTEKLEVHAPVYVVFTKADLITGFNEFFQDSERAERERAWGATLPYGQSTTSQQVLDLFDKRFDELYDGLKDMSQANMALQWRQRMPPGVFTFPLEFSTIKAPLRAFIATLFEENPFQFKPVFRGFYFTSALQDGESVSASSIRVAERFELEPEAREHDTAHPQHGYFLLNLFRNVIFADKDLVAQYASPNKTRLRYAAFFAATALVGLTLGGWSYSYLGNRKLVANVEADLQQAVKLQEQRMDLQSRFNALSILQDRIEQLEKFREDRPLRLSLGLYQGELLERKLREEYFAGVREVMLKPVAQSLETFLGEVNANAALLQPSVKAGAEPLAGAAVAVPGAPGAPAVAAAPTMIAAPTSSTLFKDASPTNAEDAYNALKTYLMLSDKPRAEGGHLNDQLTRFWRGWLDANRGTMSREDMIRNAERIISFYIAQTSDTSWPTIESKLALVDTTRDTLRKVVRGMPARERAYSDVKARAATLFKPMTVASIVGDEDKSLILGSHAIPGGFTREALVYVQDSFREAASKELQSADWVLKTASNDDLTLGGSPEQIQKALMDMYKADYAKQWQMFVQGVTISELQGFDAAALAMNRLGDPQTSPLNKLITTVYEQTSWDNPSLVDAGLQRAKRGVAQWFKEAILRQKPSQVNVNMPANPQAAAANAALPLGPVGREFSGVARMVVASDQGTSLMRGYMAQLSKLRTRFNTITNQGDPGPGAKLLMQQTLDGKEELAEALKFVDEQMLTGMTDSQKSAIRPILVRPLMQSFAVIIKPTETEIDKVWRAQVLLPFQKGLATRFPFTSASSSEATNEEIGVMFGPSGAIANFFQNTIGPIALRRGDEISARTWAEMGVTLAPQVLTNFPGWIAPLSAAGVANVAAAAGPARNEAQTMFNLQALGATGATEFTLEIDGQALRWKGQPQPWVNMVWPNAQGEPGTKLTAITPDGRTVVVLNEPGRFGLQRMVETAKRERKDGGVFKLTWENGGVSVSANLKVVGQRPASGPEPRSTPTTTSGFKNLRLPESIIGVAPPANAAALPASGGAQ